MIWVYCPKCRHKLFLMSADFSNSVYVQIKCHSCKSIDEVTSRNGRIKVDVKAVKEVKSEEV